MNSAAKNRAAPLCGVAVTTLIFALLILCTDVWAERVEVTRNSLRTSGTSMRDEDHRLPSSTSAKRAAVYLAEFTCFRLAAMLFKVHTLF